MFLAENIPLFGFIFIENCLINSPSKSTIFLNKYLLDEGISALIQGLKLQWLEYCCLKLRCMQMNLLQLLFRYLLLCFVFLSLK